jgi:tetratricopeptide (TPR) repeat protein
MALRLIVEEHEGSTQISVRLPGHDGTTPFGSPLAFTPPLSIADAEDLRFYLEDYAKLPVGEYAVRGELIERERLSAWGEALFATIFGGDEKRREAYVQAKLAADRGEAVVVAFSSNNPQFLALPWELTKAPGERDPFSLRVGAFDRSLLITDPARQFASSADGFRVLMVIARPKGINDAPFQAVARPLFKHLQTTDSAVRIDVLRPPSFDEFQQRLKAAKEAGMPYHAVHFDGHGGFGELIAGAGPQGYVVFEGKPDCRKQITPKHVSAEEFSAALKAGGVPLVILNACRSGKIETADQATGPEASVATRLLQDGAASVVAMSHSVYVVAAAAFMAVFYEALFAGRSVSEAVNGGRKALRQEENRLRPSLKGAMPLEDWIVPVHYARSTLRLPNDEQRRATVPSPAEETAAKVLGAAKIEEGHTADDLAAIDGVFFGRDAEFFTLERAIRTHQITVIHGVGGTGKTELAKAFARWLLISGGLDPRSVFVHEFLPGRPTFGLDAILGEIMARFGQTELYIHASDTASRARLVLQELAQVRGLLIWDNFETVASTPEPGQATPPLDAAKRAELLAFIGELRKTKSALLITSRSDEAWLGGPDALVRCEVLGLGERDALAYADHVLAPHAAATQQRSDDPEGFKRLLEYCRGHPLSIKLVLPHLTRETPDALLAALKGLRDFPESERGCAQRAELASLTASIEYSFRHLPEADQQRLVILSLFENVVSANILGTMDEPPGPFAGLDIEGWNALLDRLAHLGLLGSLGGVLYAMHPVLPRFLATRWQAQAGEGFALEREQTLVSVANATGVFASHLRKLIGSGEAKASLQEIRSQRNNLGIFVDVALRHQLFTLAQVILQTLREYLKVAGLVEEMHEWIRIASEATESIVSTAPGIETDAHDLWVFVKFAEVANAAETRSQLARADAVLRQVIESIKNSKSIQAQRNLAVAYHQLGLVNQMRGRLEQAEEWLVRSLRMREILNSESGKAETYYQLGALAQERERLIEAETWHNQALAIEKLLNNQQGIAKNLHALGSIALRKGNFKEALSGYSTAHEYYEAFGDQPNIALTSYQMGVAAYRYGALAIAEDKYKEALPIFEILDDKFKMAITYQGLGGVAYSRGQWAEAEIWFSNALAIFERLDNRLGMATALSNLAALRADQGDHNAALHLAIRACGKEKLDDVLNPHSSASLLLAQYWRSLGREVVVAAWKGVTGQDLPATMPEALNALAEQQASPAQNASD